ncbi:hypothetical protein HYG81_21605 (plasmid) [Natrinema zhouii]|uniref:hypothetical protein n=1 Tax=Natrinema zhouii TaxID=1710539 RepID=UPI001CFFB984|nr:hypothetical protein [Natrinema zhouii]UHQ98168.1 hypothetical protein HYG81_21605 [Natrinema zhouii]
MTFLEDADDDVWVVPAIASQRSVTDARTGIPRHKSPNREHLECRACNRKTEHRFTEYEAVPDDEWIGQPMWEC